MALGFIGTTIALSIAFAVYVTYTRIAQLLRLEATVHDTTKHDVRTLCSHTMHMHTTESRQVCASTC